MVGMVGSEQCFPRFKFQINIAKWQNEQRPLPKMKNSQFFSKLQYQLLNSSGQTLAS
jgi:hypothetical protein